MPDANTALMQRIKDAWGLKIALACASSSVPRAFLAALIANESGGDANAQRYEPTVCGHLAAVISGKAAAYDPPGSRKALDAGQISYYLDVATRASGARAADIHHLSDIATSYGLTQIMGFHVLMWADVLGSAAASDIPKFFADPAAQLKFTLQLLDFCAEENNLDLTMADPQTAGEFFTWWNCGRVNGQTYDPNYAVNGYARMQAYAALADPVVA